MAAKKGTAFLLVPMLIMMMMIKYFWNTATYFMFDLKDDKALFLLVTKVMLDISGKVYFNKSHIFLWF